MKDYHAHFHPRLIFQEGDPLEMYGKYKELVGWLRERGIRIEEVDPIVTSLREVRVLEGLRKAEEPRIGRVFLYVPGKEREFQEYRFLKVHPDFFLPELKEVKNAEEVQIHTDFPMPKRVEEFILGLLERGIRVHLVHGAFGPPLIPDWLRQEMEETIKRFGGYYSQLSAGTSPPSTAFMEMDRRPWIEFLRERGIEIRGETDFPMWPWESYPRFLRLAEE